MEHFCSIIGCGVVDDRRREIFHRPQICIAFKYVPPYFLHGSGDSDALYAAIVRECIFADDLEAVGQGRLPLFAVNGAFRVGVLDRLQRRAVIKRFFAYERDHIVQYDFFELRATFKQICIRSIIRRRGTELCYCARDDDFGYTGAREHKGTEIIEVSGEFDDALFHIDFTRIRIADAHRIQR